MKLLVVSHAAVVPSYREKFRRLCALCEDVEVLVVATCKWYEGTAWVHARPERGERYELRPLPVVGAGYQFVHFYLGLGRVLIEFQPDLIHLEEEPPSLVAWQVCKLRSRLAPEAKLVFVAWENLLQEWRGWRGQLYPRCEQTTYACADAAIAGTAAAAEVLRRRGFSKPLSVLPHFSIDSSRFAPRPGRRLRETLGLRSPVIGYVGRLIPEKGVPDLLEAFANLVEGSLLIVGAGPQRAEIDRRIEKLGIRSRVVFADSVPHDSMPDHFNCLDVLVVPSRTVAHWAEQFGRVLLEAMASGVPVIGSDSGAIATVIGSAGLTFPEGDVDALTDRLRQLLGDAALRERLSVEGRRRICGRYTTEAVASRLGRYHRLVVSGNAATCPDGYANSADDGEGADETAR